MEARNEPKTQTIDEAAKELGIGRNQAYAAARRGDNPDHPNWQAHSCAQRAVQADVGRGA